MSLYTLHRRGNFPFADWNTSRQNLKDSMDTRLYPVELAVILIGNLFLSSKEGTETALHIQ